MQNAFNVRPLIAPGFFRRLFNRPVPENGYIALENLLATRPWAELHYGHVEEALRTHGVRSMNRKRAKALYGAAVAAFAGDDVVTDAEGADLLRLRNLLGVNDDDAQEVEREIVHPRYERRIAEVLRDEHLSDAEREQLARLRKALRIDERMAIAMFHHAAEPIVNRRWNEAISDRRLGDDEQRALDALARNFGTRIDIDGATKAQLDRFHWYWLMERGTFPNVSAPINLQRDEVCHFSARAQVYEMRTETERTNSSGASVRIKIMKGVYYRVGTTSTQRITREVLRQIDTGTLYVTNKRLIFDGARKNSVIRLSAILSIVPYADGVEVEKSSGRNPIFTVDDPEWLTILLSSRLAHS
jgi:hypothetical protein